VSELPPLTEQEVRDFAVIWYQMLDQHAPLEEYRALLADRAELRFPGYTLHGWEGFQWWYLRVITEFFDESHLLKKLEVVSTPEQTRVKVLVNWQTRTWDCPAARSQRIAFDAHQSWVLKRSPQTGKPMIVHYSVDSLDASSDLDRL
jgi:hypothetical protein